MEEIFLKNPFFFFFSLDEAISLYFGYEMNKLRYWYVDRHSNNLDSLEWIVFNKHLHDVRSPVPFVSSEYTTLQGREHGDVLRSI